MPTETIECSNEQCQCMVAAPVDETSGEPQEAYCSDDCRSVANDEEEASCACGHSPCDSA